MHITVENSLQHTLYVSSHKSLQYRECFKYVCKKCVTLIPFIKKYTTDILMLIRIEKLMLKL